MNDPRSNVPPGGKQGPGSSGNGPQRPRLSGRTWIIITVVAILFNFLVYVPYLSNANNSPKDTLSYSGTPTSFYNQLQKGNIKTARVSAATVDGDFKTPIIDNGKTYTSYTTIQPGVPDNDLLTALRGRGVTVTGQDQSTPLWLNAVGLLINVLPFLFLIGLFYFGTQAARRQQSGIFGFGQSKAKLYTEERPSTTFADVAGVEAAKTELREEVDFLRDPTKYQRLGARIP